MLDGTVVQLQAMFKIKAFAATRCLVDLLLHPFAVLPMDLREDKFHRRFRPWITLEDSEGLVGPKDLPTGNAPAETAGMTEPLCFGKVRFTSPEVLGQELVLRNVYGAANVLFQALLFDNRSTDAANVPDLTVGTHDALCSIEGRSFRQDSLDQVRHGLAILWVDTIQVFLNTRRFACRIESVHSKYFGRPIVKAVGIKGPASHVGKALPFGKIKLASLQLLGVPAELFFRRFALINIQARSIPLDDVAVFIAKGHFAVEHPAVFSIRATDASLVLEGFSSREACSPLGQNPFKVFRVNKSRPIPAGHFVQSDAQVFQPRFIEVIEVPVGPGGVNQRRNRVNKELGIQPLGSLS